MNSFYIREDEECPAPSDEDHTHRSYRPLFLAMMLVACLIAAAFNAHAAPRVDEWQVWQSRGSTTNYQLFKAPTAAEATKKCLDATPLYATPSITYACSAPRLVMILTAAPAVTCPAPAAPTTATIACPAGSTGSWTQTRTTVYGPAPACAPTVSLEPTSAPADACAPIPPSGTATLNWQHDGRNVEGFRIVYGASETALTSTVQLASPTARTFKLENLAPGTLYFAVKAYQGGVESESSNVVSKVVQ